MSQGIYRLLMSLFQKLLLFALGQGMKPFIFEYCFEAWARDTFEFSDTVPQIIKKEMGRNGKRYRAANEKMGKINLIFLLS